MRRGPSTTTSNTGEMNKEELTYSSICPHIQKLGWVVSYFDHESSKHSSSPGECKVLKIFSANIECSWYVYCLWCFTGQLTISGKNGSTAVFLDTAITFSSESTTYLRHPPLSPLPHYRINVHAGLLSVSAHQAAFFHDKPQGGNNNKMGFIEWYTTWHVLIFSSCMSYRSRMISIDTWTTFTNSHPSTNTSTLPMWGWHQ